MNKDFEKINDTIPTDGNEKATDRTEELNNVSRETSNESSLTLTSDSPQLRDNETEYVDVTIDEFEGFTLGENPDIEGSWIPGHMTMVETRGIWSNDLTGQPLINLPITGETGEHYVDINFINNTTIRIYYYEVGELGLHDIGNSWKIHFINNTTQEDVQWNSTTIGDGMTPLANLALGKSVYFAIKDDSELTAGNIYPCIVVISNASIGQENLGETNTWYDFWYYPLTNIPKWFVDNNVPIPTEYPNKPSTTEGGDGTFTRVDDDIDFPDKPNVSSLDSGFIGLYNPTKEIMQALARAMWNPDFSVIMNQMSPFDNIIMFGSLPFLPSEIVAGVGLGIGNWSIPININKITDEYTEVDCGAISLNEYYGGFPDYDNEYLLYLPYIGYQPIRVDDFMDASIHVKYWCSAFSGACQCFVAREKDNHRKILYTFTGNCLTQFPISGSNYAQNKLAQSTGIMQTIASIGKGALVGGVIGGALAGAYDQYNQTLAQPKPEYNHSNGLSSDGGIFNIRKPYLIETSPIVNSPANYKHLQGIPSQIYDVLGNLEGYTEVSAINLDSINASKSEKDNLLSILKSGFYI